MIEKEFKPDATGKKQDTRFKPGQSGNPAGRPKGARNKVSEGLLEALAKHFESNGEEAIEKVCSERPHDDFVDALGLVGQLLDHMQVGRAPKKPDPPKNDSGYRVVQPVFQPGEWRCY